MYGGICHHLNGFVPATTDQPKVTLLGTLPDYPESGPKTPLAIEDGNPFVITLRRLHRLLAFFTRELVWQCKCKRCCLGKKE